jgi:hypothetical protein
VIVCVVLAVSVAVFGVSPTSASAPARVAAAGSFDQFACSLLSSSDVSGVAGQPSADGFPGTVTPAPGAQASICNFAPQDGGTTFNVTVKVQRYNSPSAAHDAFASATTGGQPTQVSGFDEASISAGSARLRHGSDVVEIDMFENPSLPPTALMTLAAAVATHYTSPSTSTQKPAVAGPGDVDPCGISLKGLKAAFHVAVTSEPVVSDPGTLGCRYTFAGHGSVIMTTATSASLAKLQPPMTLQQLFDRTHGTFIPSQTLDLTGFPGGQVALSLDTTVVQCVCGPPTEREFYTQQFERQLAKEQSEDLKLEDLTASAGDALLRIIKDAAKAAHQKVDPKTLDALVKGLKEVENEPASWDTTAKEDLAALMAMLALSPTKSK